MTSQTQTQGRAAPFLLSPLPSLRQGPGRVPAEVSSPHPEATGTSSRPACPGHPRPCQRKAAHTGKLDTGLVIRDSALHCDFLSTRLRGQSTGENSISLLFNLKAILLTFPEEVAPWPHCPSTSEAVESAVTHTCCCQESTSAHTTQNPESQTGISPKDYGPGT